MREDLNVDLLQNDIVTKVLLQCCEIWRYSPDLKSISALCVQRHPQLAPTEMYDVGVLQNRS